LCFFHQFKSSFIIRILFFLLNNAFAI
jgi:hypothetical protein